MKKSKGKKNESVLIVCSVALMDLKIDKKDYISAHFVGAYPSLDLFVS